jgi:hypothetical protein
MIINFACRMIQLTLVCFILPWPKFGVLLKFGNVFHILRNFRGEGVRKRKRDTILRILIWETWSKKGSYRTGYDQTYIENAFNEVKLTHSLYWKRVKPSGVPISALKDRLYGIVYVYNAKPGRTQLFSQ